jgi:hypothetical protein
LKALFSFFCIFGLCMFPLAARAQVHVEEEVSTDSVDIFAGNSSPEKSSAIAMTANLLLPGLGHYYIGNDRAAAGFFMAEALFIFGAFACNQYSQDIDHSARAYAYTYANVQGGAGADDFFWENVGRFMDSDGLNQSRALGYNQIQDLNRAGDASHYYAPNLQWRWADESYRTQYNNFVKKSMQYKVASNFFIGAMILNRVLSFVDVRVASRHQGKGLLSSLRFYPQYSTSNASCGLLCVSQF